MKNLRHHIKKNLQGQSLSKYLLWEFPRKGMVSPRQLHPNFQKIMKDKIMESGLHSKVDKLFDLSDLVGDSSRGLGLLCEDSPIQGVVLSIKG